MIHSVSGKLVLKGVNFVIIETGGLGLKVFVPAGTLGKLHVSDEAVKLFTYFNVKENGMELYGFKDDEELAFFEMLISVSGVGPKSAMAILDIAKLDELAAAIKENRPDLITRAAGIGRKTAERIIVELKTKVQSSKADAVVGKMDVDSDLIEALSNLGYRREEARNALSKIDATIIDVSERLKVALKILGNKN